MPPVPGSHQDLLQQQVATLATVAHNGRPQLSVIWFLAEDGIVSISLSDDRRKTQNLLTNPNCSLLILDPSNSMRYLELRGTAEVAPDDDYQFASKVGQKYGADLRQYDKPGDKRLKVTIRPERVRAVDMSS